MRTRKRKGTEVKYTQPIEKILNRMDVMMPLSLTNFDELIQELHLLYPKKSESEIKLILRSFFKAWRHFLFKNEIISFPDFLPSIRLRYLTKLNRFQQLADMFQVVIVMHEKVKTWCKNND